MVYTLNSALLTLTVLLLVASAYVNGEPIVIRDYGGHASGVPDKKKIAAEILSRPPTVAPISPNNRFPVVSSIGPGELSHARPLTNKSAQRQPLFILGDDERSLDWLSRNKAYLIQIKASGVATNIATVQAYNALVAAAAPLSIVALPVDELAESLGLPVYPVLITREEIAQ